ncbi:SHOCT domain-containing protein [Halococcus sp. IIIV-5B]|uniref:SHOCT domain-containing protein n=1 Tax=Halococcus sp. IIIV-5B TaxID=2321230 RepID=UPI000E72595A|nr:SHOCT domain-containing protein [Halococcus sp. IIIV-5B]RJT07444.1 SHOCT domain-containing protein [Halococcus sp. IIIV-5B]
MSHLDDWYGEITVVALLLAFGAGIVALYVLGNFFVTLTATAPIVAGMVMFGIVFVAAMAAADFYSDTTDSEEEASHEREPLAVLKERYARGELSEEEFEHKVTMLLDVDEIASEKYESELVTDRN